MEGLIDHLDPEKWQETTTAKRGDGFTEVHVNRNHKHPDPNTLEIMIAPEDGDPKTVRLNFIRPEKDPLKNIGLCEIKLDAEEKFIVGIDLDGDCVILK